MILLQAAMGFGLILIFIGFFLVFIGFPVAVILFYVRLLKLKKSKKQVLEKMDYFFVVLKALFYASMLVVGIALFTYLVMFMVVDLSIS